MQKKNLANKEVPLPVRNITSRDITHPVDDEFISFLLEPGAGGKKPLTHQALIFILLILSNLHLNKHPT